MSQERVEIVRAWLEALSGGSEDFDRALALVHRDVVLVPPGGQPPYRGAERMRRWMEPDAFQEQVVKAFDPVVVTDRAILGRQVVKARGATSGIELDVLTWSVWTFDDDDLITRIEIYRDHEEDKAREAAGLREPGMSQKNVEVVHQVIDAVARQDLSRLVELTDPEVEWQSFMADLGGGRTYRGHEGIHQYMQDLTDAWDLLLSEVEDTLAVGDLVLVVGELRYRGKGSGVEARSPAGYLVKLRDGLVLNMRAFRDPEHMLESVGLPE